MSDDPIRIVRLKNGGEAPDSAVLVTMISLRALSRTMPGILARYDLVQHCRTNKPITGRSLEILVQQGLMEKNATVHTIIKDVVLSTAEGDGINMTFGSPYAE